MSELSNPHTPGSEHAMRCDSLSPLLSPTIHKDMSKSNGSLGSPVHKIAAMTPPPSTEVAKPSSKPPHTALTGRRDNALASPPATLKMSPPISSRGLFGEIPSLESVNEMDEGQLRGLLTELLPAFSEARVSAAHSKLQHSLLSIETEEAAKRAAVEHDATRREVQVLQDGSPVHRTAFSPRSPHASMQRNLQLALGHCRDLQQENAILEKRLRASKKKIARLDEDNAELKEDVQLLRQRIKANRDHLNEMQSTGAISINGTPAVDFSTPLHHRTPRTPTNIDRPTRDPNSAVGSQNPFDALLLAGQVMNGEASSVPSSPKQVRAKKPYPQHMRGAHSLSSLPTTPQRSRPVTADNFLITPVDRADHTTSFSAPGTQLAYHREPRVQEDRESTISASDNDEDTYRDEDISGSQASQMATSMLRRSLESQNGSSAAFSQTPESGTLTQAKLFGQVSKPSAGPTKALKRGADSSPHLDTSRSGKKARISASKAEKVGLGIKT